MSTPAINLKKLHEIQINQGLMDVEVAGRMRCHIKTVRRMCGRDRSRGASLKNAFGSYLEFCEAIGVDPVKTFGEILVRDKN